MTAGLVKETEAAQDPGALNLPQLEQVKTICGNCAVGCGFVGEVQDGVWVSQEPWFEHPINLGSLCSKGAAAREHVISEKRLRDPMKRVNGQWQRLSWDQAMSEIVAKLQDIREQHGPDALMLLGSAHHNNETAYALRKFAAHWGSNNIDHQARICHSTTVAGLANVWGYGAMTNSMNDIRHSRSIMIIGENVCTSHPIAMQHILTAKEVNRAQVIVVDPRFSKTAAFANQYARIRSGTDVAFIYGLIYIILKNGWEDKRMLNERTYGLQALVDEVAKFDPDTVENITGVRKDELERIARTMADNRPGTVIWAMGGTQHTNGTSITRSYCALQLVLGNMGVPGGGTNVFRGHDNVQGATDLGVLSNTLPGYYGLGAGAWEPLGKRLGRRRGGAEVGLRQREDDAEGRLHSGPLVRGRAARRRGTGAGGQHPRRLLLGALDELPVAARPYQARPGKGGPASRHRPVRHHHLDSAGPPGRRVHPAGGDGLRAVRLGDQLQPRHPVA